MHDSCTDVYIINWLPTAVRKAAGLKNKMDIFQVEEADSERPALTFDYMTRLFHAQPDAYSVSLFSYLHVMTVRVIASRTSCDCGMIVWSLCRWRLCSKWLSFVRMFYLPFARFKPIATWSHETSRANFVSWWRSNIAPT